MTSSFLIVKRVFFILYNLDGARVEGEPSDHKILYHNHQETFRHDVNEL